MKAIGRGAVQDNDFVKITKVIEVNFYGLSKRRVSE